MRHPPQEPDLVPGTKLLGIGLGVIATVITGVLVTWGIARCTLREPGLVRRAAPLPADIHGMETRVFRTEAQGIELNERAEQRLSSYGWVDADARTIHVPIEVAFELYLARRPQPGAPR